MEIGKGHRLKPNTSSASSITCVRLVLIVRRLFVQRIDRFGWRFGNRAKLLFEPDQLSLDRGESVLLLEDDFVELLKVVLQMCQQRFQLRHTFSQSIVLRRVVVGHKRQPNTKWLT